jgi:D-alanyl-D-alanine carboxypeptidase (penicillin-binding protein 5/6)
MAAAAVVAASGTAPAATRPPAPPSAMSTAGGARLGVAGEQTGAGAPALPAGLSARSFVVADVDSGDILAAKNPHWQLPPASTLKMLFADTLLPKFPADEKHTVTAADLDGMGEGSSEVGIVPGQTYTVADLWRGVFLRSGNDAVHTLAAMNGGVAATVQQMQAEAQALGADDTHVVTPDGYDEGGQVSSAYDLALFARAGLGNGDFARYCATARAEFPGGPLTKGKPFGIENTNRLLSGVDGVRPYAGLIGVKNGYTSNAGNTLAVAARRNGHTILVTLMHPDSPRYNEIYTEARELLDWGFGAEGRAAAVGTLDRSSGAAAASPSVSAPGVGSPDRTAAQVTGGGLGVLGWTGVIAAVLVTGGAGALLVRRRRGASG